MKAIHAAQIFCLGLLLLFFTSYSFLREINPPSKHPSAVHIQLQNAHFQTLASNNADILIIDIDDAHLTPEEIRALQNNGKIIISYLSIGEAENYRDYWKNNWTVGSPRFIREENPQWQGNYLVDYYDPAWQEIIFEQLDTIITAGYDGVYLDVIDAYERHPIGTAEQMSVFVQNISTTAKNKHPRFLIFAQNALELTRLSGYVPAIDGIAREDLYFNDDDLQDTEETLTALALLEHARKEGKTTFILDYPQSQANICAFYQECTAAGYSCFAGNRELDQPSKKTCATIN